MRPAGVQVEMPGGITRTFTSMVLDYTGTLSVDGVLLPGVAERLTELSRLLSIIVLTADTFGTAKKELASLPVQVRVVSTGAEKAEIVKGLGPERLIGIGNGRNDVAMMEVAGLAIAVMGPEGAAGEVLRVADVVTRDIVDALDLVSHPLRLKATLRD